jgi:hypothetical protein
MARTSSIIVGKTTTFGLGFSFYLGRATFCQEMCSFCPDLLIVATSKAGNGLGVLSHTTLVWTYVEHSEVGRVTDRKYWVGVNVTRGHI